MLALLVEDVTLLNDGTSIHVHVRFRGGRTESLAVPRPKGGWETTVTEPEAIALIDGLLDEHTYEQIADILHKRGLRPVPRTAAPTTSPRRSSVASPSTTS